MYISNYDDVLRYKVWFLGWHRLTTISDVTLVAKRILFAYWTMTTIVTIATNIISWLWRDEARNIGRLGTSTSNLGLCQVMAIVMIGTSFWDIGSHYYDK